MPAPATTELPPRLQRRLDRWLAAWGTPRLSRNLRVEFSPRLRRAFGRCYREDGIIRLTPSLLGSQAFLMPEILCHESAHAAVWYLHGDSATAHGEEWRDLMRKAGFRPRVKLPYTVRRDSLAGRARSAPARGCPYCDRPAAVSRRAASSRCRSCGRAALPSQRDGSTRRKTTPKKEGRRATRKRRAKAAASRRSR